MGLVERLPEHLKSRRTAEAVTAPSAILLAGVGASAAILGGLPLVAAALIGLGMYGARVAFGLPRRPRAERIELASLPEPWRHFVREALDAQRRYRQAVVAASPGPLRDRLTEIGVRIDQGVHECHRVARRGAALEGGLSSLDADDARRHLAMLGTDGDADGGGADAELAEALRAQIASADRIGAVAQDARDRLSLLDARLDEAVARAVELSLQAEDVAELRGLGGDVETLVDEMESLRVALEEAGSAGRGTPGTHSA